MAAMASLGLLRSSFAPKFSTPRPSHIASSAVSSGIRVVCLQQKFKRKTATIAQPWNASQYEGKLIGLCFGRKRTSVSWGCDPQSLENGSLLGDWLEKEGVAQQKLVLDRVDSGERGLVARQSLRQGERLLFVPSRIIITSASEWGCSEAGEIVKAAGLPEWPTLALFLISEASLGASSRWFPYFATLPQNPTSILQWTEVEVNTWLAASPVRERALECIRDVTETYRDLRASIFSKYPGVFPTEVYSLDTFKWAFGILFSRLVRLPSLGQLALVPWADMLNHNPQVDAFLDFDQNNAKSVVFTTDRAYQVGEQVFISYGKRSSGELLIAYGFIPSESNPYDFVELELALDDEDPLYEAKLTALKDEGLSSPQRFPIRKDGMPAQLLAYARLIVIQSMSPAQLSKMAVGATESGATANMASDLEAVLSVEDEKNAYERMLAVCENSISEYTKFLEVNDEESNDLKTADIGALRISRKEMLREFSVALCRNEQRILFRLQHILRTDLRGLRAMPSTGSEDVGATGKAKRASGGLFNLFKWNIDFLEK